MCSTELGVTYCRNKAELGEGSDTVYRPNATVSAKPIEGHEHGMEELSKNTCPSRPTEGQEQPLEDTATKASVPQTFKGRTEPTSIEDKAKAYVKRKKEEQLQVVRNSLGEMSLTYDAINAANRRKMAAPYLESEAAHQDEGLGKGGDFLSTGDGRVMKMNLKVNMMRKTAISYSFDPQRKASTTC